MAYDHSGQILAGPTLGLLFPFGWFSILTIGGFVTPGSKIEIVDLGRDRVVDALLVG